MLGSQRHFIKKLLGTSLATVLPAAHTRSGRSFFFISETWPWRLLTLHRPNKTSGSVCSTQLRLAATVRRFHGGRLAGLLTQLASSQCGIGWGQIRSWREEEMRLSSCQKKTYEGKKLSAAPVFCQLSSHFQFPQCSLCLRQHTVIWTAVKDAVFIWTRDANYWFVHLIDRFIDGMWGFSWEPKFHNDKCVRNTFFNLWIMLRLQCDRTLVTVKTLYTFILWL